MVAFLIRLQALGLQLYFKKRLQQRFFHVNFLKLLKTPFWKATVSQNMYDVGRQLFDKKLF